MEPNSISDNLQNLYDYVTTVSAAVFDCSKDAIYGFLTKEANQTLMKTFCEDQNVKLVCLTKTEQRSEGEEVTVEFSLDIEAKYNRSECSSLYFLKKHKKLDLNQKASTQLQVLNMANEAEATSVFTNMQLVVGNCVAPHFNSFHDKIGRDKGALTPNSISTFCAKMNELLFLLQQAQVNSEVPSIKLEIVPEVQEYITKMKTEGVSTKIEDFKSKIEDSDFMMTMQDTVTMWKNEINSFIKLDKDVKKGNVTQEINFWKDYENMLTNVQTQLNTDEVAFTIEILKKGKKILIVNTFFEDTQLDPSIKKASSYNSLLKDFPIMPLTTAKNTVQISKNLVGIFQHIKNKMKMSTYPITRIFGLIEVLSEDFSNHLLQVLFEYDFMKIPHDKMKAIYKELKEIFSTWVREYESLRKELGHLQRQRREMFAVPPSQFEHSKVEKRIKELKKFRNEHDKLKSIAQSLVSAQEGETQISSELDAAYTLVHSIDVLDLSEEGEDAWTTVKKNYYGQTEKTELQISNYLREKLAQASNPNEEFRIFAKFNKLISRPRIQSAIQEYQTNLVSSVTKSLKELKNKLFSGFAGTSASRMSRIRGIPENAGNLIWLSQFARKLETFKDRMKMVLGASWEVNNEGKQVKDIIDSLSKNIIEAKKNCENSISNIPNYEGYGAEKALEIIKRKDKLELRVHFDQNIIDLCKDIRLIGTFGNSTINTYVKTRTKELKNIYPVAISLNDSIKSYNAINSKVGEKILKLIAKTQSEIQGLIMKNHSHTWSNYGKIDKFSRDLCEKVSELEDQVRELSTKVESIEMLLNELKDSKIDSETLQDKILAIQKVIDEVNEASNVQVWINDLDAEIENILAEKLEQTLRQWALEFKQVGHRDQLEIISAKPMKLKIAMVDQTIQLSPSLNDAREFWYKNLHETVGLICATKRLEFRQLARKKQEEQTYRSVLQVMSTDAMKQCYAALEEVLKSADEYVQTWFVYQVFWDIKIEDIFEKLGEDMEKWNQMLQELKENAKQFDNSKTKENFGRVIVDYQPIQTTVINKFEDFRRLVIAKFQTTLSDSLGNFYSKISKARSNMESNSLDAGSSNVVEFVTEIQESNRKLKEWNLQMDKFKNGCKILSKHTRKMDNINIDQVDSEWSKFKQILDKKNKSKEEQIPAIKAKIEADSEVIDTKITELQGYWDEKKPFSASSPSSALKTLSRAEEMLERVREDYSKNCGAKELLEMEFSDPHRLDDLSEDINNLREVWNSLQAIYSRIDKYRETPFIAAQPEKVKSDISQALNDMQLLPNKIRNYEAFDIVKGKLNALKKTNILVADLRSDAIKDRHWKKIGKLLKIRKLQNDCLLGEMWDSEPLQEEKGLREVINQAQGEMSLDSFIRNSKDLWSGYELEMARFKDKCKLIKGWDDLFLQLDDHITAFTSMQNSPYFPVFKEEIEPWKDKLEKIRLLFNEWIDVQRRWVYLEGIFFGSADIMTELASDFSKFKAIDNEFTGLMKKVASKPLVLEVVSIPSIKSILEEKLKKGLERIQKSLYTFLEKQRKSFARFYFIGDEDLLEIIGNSKDLIKIQRHFNKMFAGLNALKSEDGDKIESMMSREFEEVPFAEPVVISQDPVVYNWLGKVEQQMQVSLATQLESSVAQVSEMDYINKQEEFLTWIKSFPAQIVVLAMQILWSASIESALLGKNLLPALPENFSLADEIGVIKNQLGALSDQVLKDVKVDLRKKLEQLITELVHQRDVVRNLENKKVDSIENFDWLYYMRFYFSPKNANLLKKLEIRMSNAPFDYGFEYLGVAEKLIQTPLTDRCYLTLTQALYFRMGGAPFGPAGTGKTESVKALGAQLGRFVLVFNCDEKFDFKAMGRIFVGLCQVGAWGCFDEFNRLEERILSAVSQQILTIQVGLRDDLTQIDMMGNNIKLNPNMGIFITMNPDYAGRSALPDNLKQLFRSMAMVKPDKDMIAQVTLYSQGYKTAEMLASKMVSLFELCSSQLSAQSHYDFGLRALKSVLVNAGNLKRKEKIAEGADLGDWEKDILLSSVCNTLIPKLIAEDTALFSQLLSGVFPGAVYKPVDENALKNALIELCEKRNITPTETFLDKVLQLYSIQNLHHGVMMVGISGTGKSVAWKLLLEAMQMVDGIKGESYVIDPKAINKDQLYGKLDQTTLDWEDGVFTGTLRKILDNQRGESNKRHWIIFDGDVDPEWAENLNSVLDDNRLFTLPHGDRLSIPTNVRIMFEVETLKYATLATVSRCGMVWFSEDIVTQDMIFDHYIRRLAQENYDDSMNYQADSGGNQFQRRADNNGEVRQKCANAVKPLFRSGGLVSKAVEICASFEHVMVFTKIRVIESMFALVRKGVSKVLEYNESHEDFPLEEDPLNDFMTKWTVISIVWGMAGSLNLRQRVDFCAQITEKNIDVELPQLQGEQSLLDFEAVIGQTGWRTWKERVPQVDIDPSRVSDSDVVITTVDTVRHQEILCSWLSEKRPFILCGPPGSGKTMTLMATLKVLTDFEMVFVNFSSGTDPDLLLKTFDQYCEYTKSSKGTTLKPKIQNKWLVVFCDEINLPETDAYETQSVITFLRQTVEYNGFWRPSDKIWITLENIMFVGACNPPTDVGRHRLSDRFLRHCPLMYVDFPGPDSLRQIYGTFNRAILKKGIPEVNNLGDALTEAMVEFYTRCQQHYTPDMQAHYIYSPRELTRWKHAVNESIEAIATPDDLARLWAHEALRLFQDRLVEPSEAEWCDQLVDEVAAKNFPGLSPTALERPILFTNLMTPEYISQTKEDLVKYIEGKLKVFYEEELNVPLVIFDSVLEHILRIDRVLKQPVGHLLLVGQSGVGKTTLSRFVSWLNNLTVFQIKAGRNYTVEDFDEDLRTTMKRAGCKGEKITFIFDEGNVLSPAFLERMNALLAAGEVPGLFEGDDYTSLISSTKETMIRENRATETEDEVYKYFVKNVQRNLHIVFTMNPLSPDFANRAASSPALYNRCVIDWFGDWTPEGLWQVGAKLTEQAELRPEFFVGNQEWDYDSMQRCVVDGLTQIHLSVKTLNAHFQKAAKKFNYITPRDFLDFIKHFNKLQVAKNEELNEQQTHINKGLQKIIQTENEVADMKAKLSVKEVELDKKKKEIEKKFEQILNDNQVASARKEDAIKQKAEVTEMQTYIDEKTESVQTELSEVLPKLKAAKDSVQNMPPKYVSEIKSYKKIGPKFLPTLRILAAIYYEKTKNIDEAKIKDCLSKADFFNKIKKTNPKDIKDNLAKFIEKEMKEANPPWDLAVIKKASEAVGTMADWVEAISSFALINGKVEPLNEEIEDLEKKKNEAVETLTNLEKEIEELDRNIAALKQDHSKSTIESSQTEAEIKKVKDNVERSEKLLANLVSEKERWSIQNEEFKDNIDNVLGDTVLNSAFLSYIGFYDASTRSSLRQQWKDTLEKFQVRFSAGVNETEWLNKPQDKFIWQKCGLPADDICVENVTVLQRFNRYPLVIDPAGQAASFIKQFYSDKKLSTTSFSDGAFIKTLESALRFGYPLMVQDVEKIDPILNSLLNKEIQKQGGRSLIRIGDQEIDFSNTFNMFMVTRDSSCTFTPDLCSRVTFLNFTITQSSLQNQILSIVLKNERPEVDKRKEDLAKAQREFKIQLRELEEDLLNTLNSEGNLLENDKVIGQLETIKKKSGDIMAEVDKTDEIMAELEQTTQEYLPIASMASKIFFGLENLESIHYMYRYSLTFFMEIIKGIIGGEGLKTISKNDYNLRQEYIIAQIFKEIYHKVSSSLLNTDVAVLAFRLLQIRLGSKLSEEIKMVLQGGKETEPVEENILGGRLNVPQRKALAALQSNEMFSNLVAEMRSAGDNWEEVLIHNDAENRLQTDFIAHDYSGKDKDTAELVFKMILLRVLRPDRMLNLLNPLVKSVFGEEFANVPELNLELLVQETSCKSPVLLCAAPGFDASLKIEALAKAQGKRFISIALGSSEGFDLVEKHLPLKMKAGDWIVLKNVHLQPNWLRELEKRIFASNPHANFRMFLTMEFNPKVPANIIRMSRKVVFELPSGIKQSLIRTYNSRATLPEQLPKERTKIHFLLSWFHAVLSERLRYTPIGWSKYYEFNESDLRCAFNAVDEWIDKVGANRQNIDPELIPWDAIRTSIAQSLYGGKIDNEYDHKILLSLVNLYFTPTAFNLNYPLYKSSGEAELKVPECKNKDEFAEWVHTLPEVENPEWSGLPNNAERFIREKNSVQFRMRVNAIQDIEAEEEGAEDKPQKNWLDEIQEKSKELLEVIGEPAADFDLKEGVSNPLYRFIVRESKVAVNLLSKVRNELLEVIEFAKGNIKSSNELRDIAKSLFTDTVPKNWKKYPIIELTVTEWVSDLRCRVNQLQRNYATSTFGKEQTWLGGLLFPEAFLTATRQSVAQAKKVALDELKLVIDFDDKGRELDEAEFRIIGLSLEGAQWNFEEDHLNRSNELSCDLPSVIFKWVVDVDEGSFAIPVYLNNGRRNLLFSIFIKNKTEYTDADWYQRGTCLVGWNKLFEYK